MNKTKSILSIGLVMAGLSLSAFSLLDQPANFTGTWLLDASKSEIGNVALPKNAKSTVKILQQNPSIIMEKSLTDSTGKVHTAVDTIYYDGKVQYLNAGQPQQVQRTISQQWSADKKVMTLASKYTVANEEGEPLEFSGTETWKLSADGKVLTIVNETVLPDRTDMATLVYTKQ